MDCDMRSDLPQTPRLPIPKPSPVANILPRLRIAPAAIRPDRIIRLLLAAYRSIHRSGLFIQLILRPIRSTGIGQYSYADFSRAVREGIAKDGRRLYPAMPYASFAATSDSDIQALYAYFMKGVKPVATRRPRPDSPFPFNQRWGLMFWSAAFANQKTLQATRRP